MVDENLPPVLAHALAALFAGEHEVGHIRSRFGTGVKDVDWIGQLSQEARWIVLSGDSKIAKRKAEQAAFRNSRLIGFFFAPALTRAKATKQMQRVLACWEDIENISKSVAPGAMYELTISGKPRQL